MSDQVTYTVGGTVQAGGGIYISREADEELLRLCRAGEFCYVLTARQMGKSSLMVATRERLAAEGIRSVEIDLTEMGSELSGLTAEQWYLGLIDLIVEQLDLDVDYVAWWDERARLGSTQRLSQFLRQVVLEQVSEPVVIFIDEIDSTLNLDFTDDFFAAIRACYNARASDPAFKRLSFVLLGVATPGDLISDPQRTPFNVGRRMDLTDFTERQAIPLAAGLGLPSGEAGQIMTWIMDWTGGHPYLTQRLCAAVATSPTEDWDAAAVDKLVEKTFLGEQSAQDSNLRFVRDMLTQRAPDKTAVLKIYRRIHAGQAVPDEERSPIKTHLKLSGIVKAEDGHLHIRNEIYCRVFDLAWVRENTAINWTPIAVGIAILTVLLTVGFVMHNVWVGNQVDASTLRFYRATTPEERVVHLANIFEPPCLFQMTDYDHRARELFYGLSRKEQLALFSVSNVEDSDLIVVMKGLYITLADTDGTDSTRPLLEAMVKALGDLEATEETKNLEGEISSWLEGRKLAKQNQYADALAEYNKAIALNSENPATLYERARVLIELSEYQQALSDLDQVMAIARRAPALTPTASPSTTTPIASPTLTPTSTSPGADITPTETPAPTSATPISTPLPIATETPIPTATSTPAAITSKFATTGDMRSAVRDIIYGNQNLVSFLASAPSSEYPNLREFGLVPTLTPTLIPSGEMPPGLAVKLYWVGTLQKYDDPGSNPSRVIVRGRDIYVLDEGTDRVYKYLLNEAGDGLQDLGVDPVLLRKGDQWGDIVVGDLVDMVWMPAGAGWQTSNLLVLESGGSLLEYDPILGLTVLPVADKDKWRYPQLIGGYFGNFYLLNSQSNQIFKYLPTADGGYSNPPEAWLQVPVDLAEVVDMAIDGYIYLLYADGRILKFMGGELAPFEQTELDEPLRGPTAIFTGPDEETKFLYVADAGNGRIVQFSKEGQFIRQFRAAEAGVFDQLRSLYVDEVGSKFYVLSGNALDMANIP